MIIYEVIYVIYSKNSDKNLTFFDAHVKYLCLKLMNVFDSAMPCGRFRHNVRFRRRYLDDLTLETLNTVHVYVLSKSVLSFINNHRFSQLN